MKLYHHDNYMYSHWTHSAASEESYVLCTYEQRLILFARLIKLVCSVFITYSCRLEECYVSNYNTRNVQILFSPTHRHRLVLWEGLDESLGRGIQVTER